MTNPSPDKIAIVVIHGMGEQRPMHTLRGFIETLWERDASLFEDLDELPGYEKSDTWSKPDRISGSAELRRITTARARDPNKAGKKGIRADFFELHWADLTADTTWNDFLTWFRRLLWRNPFQCEIPRRLLPLWCFLWAITIAIVLSSSVTALSKLDALKDTSVYVLLQWRGWVWMTAGLLVVGTIVKGFLTSYFGDVGRYVSAAPRNIKVRLEARERGLKLLRKLHESNQYFRVIIVGHSLGSILAHDLVALAWEDAANELDLANNRELLAAVQDCESKGLALLAVAGELPIPSNTPSRDARGCQCSRATPARDDCYRTALQDYRMAQRTLWCELAKVKIYNFQGGRPAWLISDLVTLGSPLTYADFLIARNGCELRAMTRSREILRSPSIYEVDKISRQATLRFSPSKNLPEIRMHHGAGLAPIRWSNIHDVGGGFWFLRGDVISGPVSKDFGPGVLDVKVAPRRSGWLGALFPRLFTHTLYWDIPGQVKKDAPDHVEVLRNAVNVLDDASAERALLDRASR